MCSTNKVRYGIVDCVHAKKKVFFDGNLSVSIIITVSQFRKGQMQLVLKLFSYFIILYKLTSILSLFFILLSILITDKYP